MHIVTKYIYCCFSVVQFSVIMSIAIAITEARSVAQAPAGAWQAMRSMLTACRRPPADACRRCRATPVADCFATLTFIMASATSEM